MTRPRRSAVRVTAGALAAAATAALAVASAAPARAAECVPVSVISARGTTEPQSGSWLQKPVGDKIAAQLPGQTAYTELEYPAAPNFDTSPAAGVTNLVKLLNAEAQRCPDQRYVLLGYSQGAMVTGDALVPPAQRVAGRDAGEVSAAASAKIAAVVFYGNPRFVAGEPFNAGTPEPGKSGDRARGKGDLDAYATRLMDICQKGDFVCQKGGGVLAHLLYFFNSAQDEGAAFAVQKIKG